MEAKFWKNLYESKLAEIKDNNGFQEETIDNLDQDIQAAQSGNGANALWVLTTLSYYKGLNIYEEEF